MASPPSPSERTERFNLRTTPDERACVEDVQDRMGGSSTTSLNTAFCMLIVEGYHYRVASAGWAALPVDPESWAYVAETADELGITSAEALRLLIRRGAPHQPHKGCLTPTGPVRAAPPDQNRIPVNPAGRAEAPNGPRYATPKPPDLPKVAPVPGQVPFTEGENA
jgi:hypothetical protein